MFKFMAHMWMRIIQLLSNTYHDQISILFENNSVNLLLTNALFMYLTYLAPKAVTLKKMASKVNFFSSI